MNNLDKQRRTENLAPVGEYTIRIYFPAIDDGRELDKACDILDDCVDETLEAVCDDLESKLKQAGYEAVVTYSE